MKYVADRVNYNKNSIEHTYHISIYVVIKLFKDHLMDPKFSHKVGDVNKSRFFIVLGVCPVLCSGHGQYGGGICHCEEGWKGPECDVPEGDCRIADCSGHGKCVRGFCQCKPGWKGNYLIPQRFTFPRKSSAQN